MRKFIFAVLLLISAAARGNETVLLSTDELSRTFLILPLDDKTEGNKIRFQIKVVFNTPRDMMGLSFNATTKTYVISCKQDRILLKQEFLLDNDITVWTFPASKNKGKLSSEFSRDILAKICP